jgi:NAD(P)-dependent dehydrogenase (short-subunit alcohol dehydrogenase family)
MTRSPPVASPPRSRRLHRLTSPETVNRPLRTVLIAGCGRNFGHGAAEYFANQAESIVVIARNGPRLGRLATDLERTRAKILPFACDLTDERAVQRTLRCACESAGTPDIAIYSVEHFCPGKAVSVSVAAFEESWRTNCLGAFIVAREMANMMLAQGKGGTIVLMGGTSSVIAREGYLNLAVGKFGLRALAHVLARELGPQGVHVVHCLIDAEIAHHDENAADVALKAEHLAAEIHRLHQQPKDCWTSELDLRPSTEKYWEHC